MEDYPNERQTKLKLPLRKENLKGRQLIWRTTLIGDYLKGDGLKGEDLKERCLQRKTIKIK